MKITVRGDSFIVEPETSNEANRLSRLVGYRVFLTEEGCFLTSRSLPSGHDQRMALTS